MTHIDKSKPVLVTGANGYVACWLVKQLLEVRFNVHSAERNPENKETVNHIDGNRENNNINNFSIH